MSRATDRLSGAYASIMATRTSARRRQRSVRVTVAIALMVVATVIVVAALPTRSAGWMSVASVVGIVCAWAALRMMWTEVLQSRRENARDRASTAAAYKDLFSQRASEHAEFTTAMTERLADSQKVMHEIEGELIAQQRRAVTAESRLGDSNRRLDQARAQVGQLESELTRRQAELSEALSSWEAEGGGGDFADLADFELRAQAATEATKGRHVGVTTRSANRTA